jgi:hypothetical protein
MVICPCALTKPWIVPLWFGTLSCYFGYPLYNPKMVDRGPWGRSDWIHCFWGLLTIWMSVLFYIRQNISGRRVVFSLVGNTYLGEGILVVHHDRFVVKVLTECVDSGRVMFGESWCKTLHINVQLVSGMCNSKDKSKFVALRNYVQCHEKRLIKHHPMKMYRRVEILLHVFLTYALHEGDW